jgi:peptidoglycan/xylan/chitin deacetylase (PgdA/CDA1 family)
VTLRSSIKAHKRSVTYALCKVRWPRRPVTLLVVALLVVLSAVAALLVRSSASSAAPNSTTIVSLTFDDGRAVQYSARGPLAAHGMRGTFFVNSGLVAATTGGFYMTWAQIQDLGADGNEITGHSLTHAHLTQLQSADLRHEVCDDRTNLLNHGFSPVLSFAYPYSEYNATVKSMVRDCGYLSGRTVGGIRSGNVCSDCPFAETIPPPDAYATRTPEDITNSTSLAQMQTYVTQAEQNGGGWVQFVFHDVGTNQGISLSQFTAFLDWLGPRAANGTVVETVGEVMGQPAPPPPPPPPPPDTTPPTVSITDPAEGATITAANVTVAANATDAGSGVRQVAFYVDGTALGTDTSAPYRARWRARSSGNGQHVLTAVATDVAGNSATSPAVTVTVR